jgi:thiaminase/transcriptional activator TenA
VRGFFDQLKAGCADDWRAYVEHAFVRGMADGTLPEPAFRHYLVQDYLFLIHFARAYALAAYKADDLADMRAAAATLHALLDVEMSLHVKYCAGWGINEATMVATPEATATIAYTRFVLDAGMQGDALDLATALAPCVVGYGEIGTALKADPATKLDGNPYRDWIEMYAGDDYQQAVAGAVAQLDRLGQARLTEARRPKLQALFRQATRLEAGFWQMGWSLLP